MGYWKVKHNQDKSKPISERRIANVLFKKEAGYPPYGPDYSPLAKTFWVTPDGETVSTRFHILAVQDYLLQKAGVSTPEEIKGLCLDSLHQYGDETTLLKNRGLTDEEIDILRDTGSYAHGYDNGNTLRLLALRNLDWIRVRGRDIETYSLTSQLLNSLTTALESMYGVDSCENTLFNIEVHSPRNFFVNVPYHVLKSGSGLGRYKEGFGKNSQNYTLNKKFWITGKGEVLDVPHTHYETALEYVIGGSREFVTNLRRQNIPGSVLKEKYGLSDEKIRIIKGITPVTDYLMKNEGWIRVNGR